jgi:hypothetical protein
MRKTSKLQLTYTTLNMLQHLCIQKYKYFPDIYLFQIHSFVVVCDVCSCGPTNYLVYNSSIRNDLVPLIFLWQIPVAACSKAWVCAFESIPGERVALCCECCVLSGRGLYQGLIFLQKSPTECGVSECKREA